MNEQQLTYDALQQHVERFELPAHLLGLHWYAIARGALPFATMLAVKHNRRFGIIDPTPGHRILAPLWPVVGNSGAIVVIEDCFGTGRTRQAVLDLLARQDYTGSVQWVLLIKNPGDECAAHVLEGGDTYYHLPWEPNGV